MGYFANLLLVEAEADAAGVSIDVSVYDGPVDEPAYFMWGEGSAPQTEYSFASGTLFTNTRLSLLQGYPRRERRPAGNPYESENQCLIQADLKPRHQSDAVLVHMLLPQRFAPRRDMTPLQQPAPPYVRTLGERFVVTYSVRGRADVAFWMRRLRPDESVSDFDAARVLHADEKRRGSLKLSLKLGIFSVEREFSG